MSRTAQLLLIDLQPETPLRALTRQAGLACEEATRVDEARQLLRSGPERFAALLVSPGGIGDWTLLGPLLDEVLRDQPTRPVLLAPAGLAPRRLPEGITRLETLPSPEELSATVRALIAYRDPQPVASAPGAFQLDADRREVRLDGLAVPLTAKEYLLLELLSLHRGRLFKRDEILERIWGLDFVGDDRIVDAYIKRLRKKVGEDAVETVRGLGYRCPEVGRGSRTPQRPQQQPHFQHLPLEARLMTLLAERVLRVSEPGEIMGEVLSLLGEAYPVTGVSLRAAGAGEVLAHAGETPDLDVLNTEATIHEPHYQPPMQGVPGLALIPLVVPDAEPWATLVFQAEARLSRWDEATCSALEVVSALVSPALRLNWEIARRERAEAQVRKLNGELEERVKARTRDLARATRQSEALYALSQRLEDTRSVQEVCAEGLAGLCGMAGAQAAALWSPGAGEGAPLAAYTQAGAVWTVPADLASTAGDWRLATGDHTVQLHAPSPDASRPLLEAAVRSFGLALERSLHAAHLEHAALTDEFSGLPNRRAFLADLTAEVAFSTRHGSQVGLSLFEIQNIRELNTRRGHAGGSALIRALALALQGTLRLEDRAYRIGGATFAALLPGRAGALGSAAVAERLNAFVESFMAGSGLPGSAVRVRAVHLNCPTDAASVADLLRLGLDRLMQTERDRPLQSTQRPLKSERYAEGD